MPAVETGFFRGVTRLVSRIPRGRVVTYGQVARMIGRPGAARVIGWALHALPDGSQVPWHRVVNAQGRISGRGAGPGGLIQRQLLEVEGVAFDGADRIDLDRYRWNGRALRVR